jgi:acetylornithine deacetylase/succinyl-diaminopimelate desuccinylase-like protein
MRGHVLSVAALALVACGTAPSSQHPATSSAPTVSAAIAPSPPPTTPTPPASPRSLEEEARALLVGLASVDTSQGHETDALLPIAETLKQAGVETQILESAPGRGNLIARLKGNGSKKPLLLLAHVDVVPVEGQRWATPPFKPTDKDGFLWGRGIADDKSMAAAFTATMLELARQKTPLSRDVILALTADEEQGGHAGVQWLLANHKDLIGAEVALNEGGSLLTTNDFSNVQLAGISVAEKSYQSYRIVAKGGGGHSSIPKLGDDPSLALARALVKIGEHRFPARVLPEVRGWLAASASWEKPPLAAALKRAAESAPKLREEDERVLSNDRSYNALLRTTCVTTMLKGSPQDNVLPTTAEAVVNCRILPDETREATRDTLARVIGDPKIEVTPLADNRVGPSSPLEGAAPSAIEKVARATFPNVPIVRTMSTGATDSRHLRAAGIVAYGVSAAPTSIEEIRAGYGAHGPDERRPTKWLGPGTRYLRDIVLELAR